MNVGILGAGVVTPLGFDVEEVARRIASGERAHRIEKFDILAFTTSDRLRRSPPVSLFAVAAASRALADAGLAAADAARSAAREDSGEAPKEDRPAGAFDGSRCAVIAAVSKGAMQYSERFHGQFVKGGAKAVVPLLFPETVANAPASHVAAVLGLRGPNTTLLGDAAVAFNAIAMARDLLEWGLADHVLVVAPHEHAAIMAAGYARFRALFRGAPWSEGAAALLLGRGPGRRGTIVHVDRGFPYRNRREIPELFGQALRGVPSENGAPAVVSVSGGEPSMPEGASARVAIKDALGDAFTAGALWQVVFGLRAAPPDASVLATCVGLNEQVSVLLARR